MPTISPVAVDITALSHEGRGIAHVDGKTVFIEGGLPGERVVFEYTRKHRSFDEGRIVEIIQASPARVKPPCAHFGVCGGCSQQHMSPEAQIQHKQTVLLENLSRFGKITPKNILPPLLGPTKQYRYKARLGVKYVDKKQKLLIGFREKQGRYLADLESCFVLHPAIGEQFDVLRNVLMSLDNYRVIPQIEVAAAEKDVALVFRHLEPLSSNDLEKLKQFSHKYAIRIYLQPAGIDSVHALEFYEGDLFYCLPEFDLTLFFNPLDFTQINFEINRQLVSRAIQLLDIQLTDHIIDFFCGLGNFTLPMARFAKHVTGVEGAVAMVKRATSNAAKNHIYNTEFYSANLTHPADINSAIWNKKYDKILLDPPRTGAIELIQSFSFSASRVVYVSCNPATLARDAAYLCEHHGYQLESAGVMDMFPHTSHVESIAVFSR